MVNALSSLVITGSKEEYETMGIEKLIPEQSCKDLGGLNSLQRLVRTSREYPHG